MHASISIQDKKVFIQWFLKHYQLKRRECIWMLTYLVKHDQLLTNIHFVRDAKYCPRAIIMTSNCSDKLSFRYYKKQVITDDTDKLFHDIRLNQDEALYIQLNFKDANQSPSYAGVLEENPYTPIEWQITKQDQNITEQLMDHSLLVYKKKALKLAIDCALDEMDKVEFLKLTDALDKLES